ncbi:hypothetical protein BDZ97DRAFT_1924399 [Flammula alnicola]|nr:hypothetical protein BDZ97DRAFT_1924399 [Flammula alnicola]
MAVDDFLKLANSFPQVLNHDMLLKISSFLLYTPRFKADILLAQASSWPASDPPLFLPESVTILLSDLCDIDEKSTNTLVISKGQVWGYAEKAKVVDERFKLFGKDLGYTSLYPPFNYCTNAFVTDPQRASNFRRQIRCKGYSILWIKVFALMPDGLLHNYSVKDGMRHYYDGSTPEIIQVGEHQFVERKVVNMWRTDTNISWKSFTNCARTYEIALSGPDCLPVDWTFKAALKGDHVQDGFTILSLLEDHHERNTTLIVPHTGEQADRFTEAIKARNARIKLYGQKEVLHRCKKCTRIYNGNDGKPIKSVWVAVMDGVTLGHTCCAVHNCKIPLTTSRDRYCTAHRGSATFALSRTAVNLFSKGKGRAYIHLTRKLTHPNDGIAQEVDVGELIDDEEEEEFEVDEQNPNLVHGINEGVSDLRGASPLPTGSATKKRISAQFGRRRTHNEQILVAPCGMILARETFFGAEAIATCAEFVKRTFSINGQKPNHLFFDNNCSLAKHVKDDRFFKDIGLTVDVFHFNCKHSSKISFVKATATQSTTLNCLEKMARHGILTLLLLSRQMCG